MRGKLIYILIAALVLIGAGFYLYDSQQRQALAPTLENANDASPQITETDNTSNQAATVPVASTNTVETPAITESSEGQMRYSDETDISTGVDVAVQEVVYNGNSFTPASLTIKNGDIVIFKNESDKKFWPASAPHPSHTAYPEFDAKSAIGPGESFQFKFIKNGTWGYHDHLTPSVRATISVTK